MRRVLLFLLILTVQSVYVFAGQKHWNNPSGGNWYVDSNWTPNGIPTASDTVFIDLTGTYTVVYNLNIPSIKSVYVGASSGIQTLSNPGNVNGVTDTLFILANGVFQMTGGSYTATRVINHGTIRLFSNFGPSIENHDSLLIGGTNVTLSGNLANQGNVYVSNTGTFSLAGGSSSASGNFFVSSGSSVSFNSGTHILDASSSISGAGNVTFSSTTTTLSGSFNITGTTVNSAGTTTFNGSPGTLVSIADSLHMSGGTLNLITGDSIIVPKIRMNSATTVLLVNAPIRFTKSFTHNAGTLRGNGGSGVLLVSPGLVYDIPTTSTTKWQKLTVLNEGTIQWSGSFSITLDSGVVINNYGLFNPLSTGTVTLNHSSGTMSQFNNYGTYRRSVGTTVSNINALFNGFSGSVVDVQNGTLAFNQNSVFNDADASVSSGALLQINDTSSWDAASSISGAGNVEFSSLVTMSGSYNIGGYTSATGGTTTFDGTSGSLVSIGDSLYMGAGTLRLFTGDSIIVGAVRMNSLSGVLSLNALLRFTRTFTHNAGTLNGLDPSVTVIVSPGLTYNAATTSTTRWRRMTLLNQGTVQWTGSFSITLDSGVVINNYGLFNPQSTGTVTLNYGVGAMAQFNNYGTYRRSVGTTVSNINALFNGYSGSLVEIQSGTLAFNQNSVFTDADASVSSGTLLQINDTSSWDAASSISGSGNVQFNASSTVSGGYTISGTTSNTAGSTTFNNGTGLVGIFDSVYVSSGTLTFSTVDTVRINRLQLSGGTLTGSAPVWINTVWNWSSGTLSGSDSTVTLVIAPGAGLNVSSGSAKTMSRRTVVNYGTMIHTGTSFTYTNGAVFDNKPPGVINLAGSNSGFSYSAGTSKPRIKNSGLLKKTAGTASTIAIVVENTDGRIEVQTTSLTLSDTTKWTNSVDTVFAGATMIFSGGTATKHVFDSGSRLAGYGNVTFSNGTATLSGTYDILGVSTFTGDTVKLNGAGGSIQSLGDSVSVTGGTVTITAPDNIQLRTLRQSAGTFNVSTGDSIIVTTLNLTNGTLGGTAPIYVNSKFVLNGGTVVSTDSSTTITVPVGATFYWSGNGTFQRRTFNNYGTAIWTSPWGLDMNAVYNNMPGALTDWTVDGNTNWFGGTSNNFNNYGTLRKSGGTGISSFEYYVNNYGLIEVQSGTLYFGASGTHAGGGFVLSPGSTIDFAAGNHTFDASSNVTGTGTVLISPTTFAMDGIYNIIGNTTIGGGTINFDSTFSTTNRTTINGGTTNFRMMPGHFLGAGNRLNVAGGTVNFVTTDSLKVDTLLVNGTVSGNNHWYVRNYLQLTAGTMASPNRALSLTLPAGSTFNWSGNGTVSQRTVFNYGTANWSSPWGFSDSTVYNNMTGAVTNLTTDYNSNWFFATGEPYLINYGTLNKSGGTGISSFEYQISNYGTMQVDSGLTILCYDSLVNFSGGIVTGKGTLDVSTRFTNSGTIRPGTSPGKLRVTGNLKNTSTAIYDAEIGGKNLGQFDELRASGSATLAGILNVSLIDGYLPALNDTVKVLNYSSKTGAFGEINGLRTGGPYDFVPLYKDTALFLIASDSLNSEPIASTDFLSAPEDVETHLPVLRNDVDSNSDALSIVEILPGYPQNGTAYIGSPDTTIVYTSPLNYFGKDTLRYVIYDGRGGWDTAGVSISVTPVNDAPSPKDTFAIADQFGIARINVIATATDVEGSSLFASTASKPKYGEAHVDGNDSFVVYVPPVYFTGVDSFKFYVSDGGAVDSATIVVTVTAGDSFLVTRSNFNTNDEGWNTFNDVSDSAFLSTGGNPGGFFYAVDAVTGAWWYFNAPSKFLGDLSSTYNKTLRFDMKQKPAGTDNSQPDVILIGNGVQLNYDFPSNPRTNFTGFGLILNETTGWKKQTTGLAPSQLEMQTVLANVTTLRIRGEFTAGADSAGIDNIILVKIPDNSSPVANTDNASTNEEVSLQVSPLANDTDAESQSLTITAVSSALNGTATIDVGNLTITYKPDSNFAGLDSFAYYITDGYGGQDSAYIRVTVNNINDAPVVAAAIPDTSFNEDFGKSFLAMMPNVFNDVDNGPTYGASNLSAGVTPLISNDSLYLLSSALFAGNVDIRVTAFDGEYTVADTFTVTVSSVNQAPVVAIPFRDTTLAEDFAKTFLSRLTQNFTDPNLDTLFFNVSSSSGNVIPSLQNDSLYLTGLANFNGTVAIYVGATDGSLSVADTFLVHVATQNDAASSFVLLIPAHNTLTNILRPAFKWNASHDIDGDTVYYHLEISTLQNFSSIFQSYTIIDTFQTLTSDLDSLGIYYWRVTADDHKGGAFQSSSFTLNVDAKRPNVHISLLQGTITKRYLDAYAYADEDLSGAVNSTFTLKNSSGTTIDNRSAAMSKIGTSNLYTSSYHLTNVGSLEVQVTAQDAAANQRIATRNYTVSALLKGETFVSLSPEFEVSSIKPALSESGFLLTGSITEIESTLMPSMNAGVELIGTTELKDALKLTIRYDASEMSSLMLRSDFDERKIGVYRVTEFGFEYAGGQGRLFSVSTTVNSFGKYVALYDQNHAVIPEKIELSQNYPNPFNPTTTIQYGLAATGRVKLLIYNILGQHIRELVDANQPAGYYKILWDGRNAAGQIVATGIYFYRLETPTGVLSRKMLLIK